MEVKVCKKCKEEKCVMQFRKNKSVKSGLRSECKACQNEYNRKWNEENREKQREHSRKSKVKNREHQRKWREENRERLREYKRKWLKNGTPAAKNYRIAINLRRRVNGVINGAYKSAPTLELLGCSIEELKQHIEAQFAEGMIWDNYGKDGWHIDHIKPCASFDLTDPEQQRQCLHYTNLQPLFAEDNLSKGAKLSCGQD